MGTYGVRRQLMCQEPKGMTFWFWIGEWSHATRLVTDGDRPEGGETEGRETTWKVRKK